jgi:hypothetical protein
LPASKRRFAQIVERSSVVTISDKPSCTAILLCDDVVVDPATQKVHLIGVFNAIRPADFPSRRDELCVFVAVTGFVGSSRLAVVCTEADSDRDILGSFLHSVNLHDSLETRYLVFRLRDCVFRVPGEYRIQRFAGEFLIGDTRLALLSPKGDSHEQSLR